MNFNKCREEVAGANALNTWKFNIIILLIIEFHLDPLPPGPLFAFRNLTKGSRNSMGSLFWRLQIGLLAMLWSFEKWTTSAS